jgi:IS5 family transposase
MDRHYLVSIPKVQGLYKDALKWYKRGMNKLFEPLKLKFGQPNWARNPEFCVIDTILEEHPELIRMMKDDICRGSKESNFGRQDVPSVEQVVRCAIYKELRRIDYEELDIHQEDSKICERFLKLERKQFSQKTWQKYIARISGSKLDALMVALNRLMIDCAYEDVSRLVQDSTVVESDIHYPTNNSLVWDCIKESSRLLSRLKEEINAVDYRDYMKGAKRTCYKINNTKSEDKRAELFRKQLVTFTKCINQVSNALKKKLKLGAASAKSTGLLYELGELLPVMEKVYSQTERHEIRKETVPNKDKVFPVYEQHTDIIVKGQREVQFGHKVNIGCGKSNLILGVEIPRGNPSDGTLYQSMLDKVITDYGIVPRAVTTDGGYAGKANLEYAKGKGIANIVFTKIVGSLENITTSVNMETRLKKWRSAIEAVISNLKRGFGIRRCGWKGWEHFVQKVYWSVIGYNIRVMTACILAALKRGTTAEAAAA